MIKCAVKASPDSRPFSSESLSLSITSVIFSISARDWPKWVSSSSSFRLYLSFLSCVRCYTHTHTVYTALFTDITEQFKNQDDAVVSVMIMMVTCLSSVNLCSIFSSGVILLSYSPKRLSMNWLLLSFSLNSFRRVSFLCKHSWHQTHYYQKTQNLLLWQYRGIKNGNIIDIVRPRLLF